MADLDIHSDGINEVDVLLFLSKLKSKLQTQFDEFQIIQEHEQELLKNNKRLNGLVASLEQQLSNEQDASDGLRSRLLMLEQQDLEKERKYQEWQNNQRDSHSAEVDRLKSLLSSQQQHMLTLKGQVFEFENEQRIWQADRRQLQSQLETREQSLSRLEEAYKTSQMQLQRARVQFDTFDTLTADFRARLTDIAVQDVNHEEHIAELNKQIRQLRECVDAKTMSLLECERELERTQQQQHAQEVELGEVRAHSIKLNRRIAQMILERRRLLGDITYLNTCCVEGVPATPPTQQQHQQHPHPLDDGRKIDVSGGPSEGGNGNSTGVGVGVGVDEGVDEGDDEGVRAVKRVRTNSPEQHVPPVSIAIEEGQRDGGGDDANVSVASQCGMGTTEELNPHYNNGDNDVIDVGIGVGVGVGGHIDLTHDEMPPLENITNTNVDTSVDEDGDEGVDVDVNHIANENMESNSIQLRLDHDKVAGVETVTTPTQIS